MTFLNPAVLLGFAAASIPVIIHLLNLRKLKVIEFSTLKFLKELQKNKIRRVKLKQWLLLALRVLIILLVVSAFARPTLEGINIGGTTSAAKTTAIFILDDTFSMSVITPNGSYFNQAKQMIRDIISNLQEEDEAGLILVSGDTEEELTLTSNTKSISDNIESIIVSGSSGTINNAVIRASEIIGESKNFNKEIYLLSDFQKNRIFIHENISDLSRSLNKQVKLYSFDFSDKEIKNISIDELDIKTKIFELNKPIIVESIITNHSNNFVVNQVVSLFINSKRSAQKSIDLSPNESKAVSLEGLIEKSGQNDVFVEIEDDEIIKDNRRYASINLPEQISVLLLYDVQSDINFINLALKSAQTDKSLNITTKPLNGIESIRFEDYNVVFLIADKFDSSPERLKRFVSNGGGLVMYPSSNASLQQLNSLFSELKLPSASGISELKNDSNLAIDFDRFDSEHPLLQNIFINENKKSIKSPRIYKHIKVTSGGKGESVITLLDGSSFLSEYNYGNGKILLYNVSPTISWSDFPLKSIFAPLVYKSVIYLTAGDNVDPEYLAGESINFNVSKRTSPGIKIVLPDNSEEFINLNGDNLEFINYSKTFNNGNYRLYSGDRLLETVSVNPDPAESIVDYITDADFDNYLNSINFKGSHIRVPIEDNPSDVILQARFGSELWRYFLMAAFLLALIEMAVSRAAKKELAETEK